MVKEYSLNYSPYKNGRFRYWQRYANPLKSTTNHTVYGRVSVVLDKDTPHARNMARKILREKIQKILNKDNFSFSIDQLIEDYQINAKKRLAYTTYYSKKCTSNIIREDLGKETLAYKLDTKYFNRYFDDLLYKRDLSNATVASYKSIINQSYELAVSHGYLKSNPIINTKINYKSEIQKRRFEIENKYLEESELKKILSDIRNNGKDDIADLLEFQSKTGMRIGEVLGLQKKNILEVNGIYVARITGDLYRVRNSKKSNPFKKSKGAKNLESNRDVILSPKAKKIAFSHIKDKKAEDYVFVNPRSPRGVYVHEKLNLFLRGVKKRTKINKQLTTHTFRHTYVSILAQKGVPLYIIQSQTGHNNSRIISKIYLHVTKTAKKEFSDSLNKIDF